MTSQKRNKLMFNDSHMHLSSSGLNTSVLLRRKNRRRTSVRREKRGKERRMEI